MGILAEKLERCRKAVILKDTVESVEALVREIGSELMDFALRRCKPEIAKEICQETLLVIALKYREFRGSEDRQFRSWCYTILRRKLSNYFRDEKPALFEPLSESEQWEIIAARDKEIAPGVKDDLEYAMGLLGAHKPLCREWLWLHHIWEWDIQSITEAYGRTYNAVRMHLNRCLELAELLMEKHP